MNNEPEIPIPEWATPMLSTPESKERYRAEVRRLLASHGAGVEPYTVKCPACWHLFQYPSPLRTEAEMGGVGRCSECGSSWPTASAICDGQLRAWERFYSHAITADDVPVVQALIDEVRRLREEARRPER